MALGAQPILSPSVQTTAANKKKTQLENSWNNRGTFSSDYTGQLKDVTNQITNRQPFSYDFQNDPIYNQYRDTYVNQGMRAQQNAQANAATLTGGFGNSYATLAGNQAFEDSLSQLADKSAEIAQQAYSRYQDEGQNLYNQAELLQNLENTDYNRYRDTVGDLYNDLKYYQDEYQYLNDLDFNYYKNNLDKWLSDRDYYYQKSLLNKENKKLDKKVSVKNTTKVTSKKGTTSKAKKGKISTNNITSQVKR